MAGNTWARNIQRQLPDTPSRKHRRARKLASAHAHVQEKFRNIRLKTRRRVFEPDGGASRGWFDHAAPALSCAAIAGGYTLAIYGRFDTASSLFAPFVLVGLVALFTRRVSAGPRLLGVAFCLIFFGLAWWL